MKKWFTIFLISGFAFLLLPLLFVMITEITLGEILATVVITLSMLSFELCALLRIKENRQNGKSIYEPLIFAIAIVLVFAGTIGRMVF